MTERLQVYKCEVCGNIVEMVHEVTAREYCSLHGLWKA
jgi:desulfoferrodoxin-like iron-binding protein